MNSFRQNTRQEAYYNNNNMYNNSNIQGHVTAELITTGDAAKFTHPDGSIIPTINLTVEESFQQQRRPSSSECEEVFANAEIATTMSISSPLTVVSCSSSNSENDADNSNNNVNDNMIESFSGRNNDDSSHLDESSLAVAEMVIPDNEPNVGYSRRSEFISVAFFKESKESLIGIGLKNSMNRQVYGGRHLKIRSIESNGLLGRSPLRVGDTIISINNTECKYMDGKTARSFLQSLSGLITIIVHNTNGGDPNFVESMIPKAHPNDPAGITLKNSRGRLAGVYISNIISDGLVASSSLLNIGDRILSVNDRSCIFGNCKKVASMIRQSRDYVTIVAKTKSESAAVLATSFSAHHSRPKILYATVYKETQQESLGLGLVTTEIGSDRRSKRPVLTISSVRDDGMLAESSFEPGDILMHINQHKSKRMDHKEARHMLRSMSGYITLEVHNHENRRITRRTTDDNNDDLIQAMIVKPTQDYRTGILLRKNENNEICISKFEALSLFKPTLNVGDVILTINNVPCENLDLSIAANIIRNASSFVSIVARKASSSSNNKKKRTSSISSASRLSSSASQSRTTSRISSSSYASHSSSISRSAPRRRLSTSSLSSSGITTRSPNTTTNNSNNRNNNYHQQQTSRNGLGRYRNGNRIFESSAIAVAISAS